MEKHQRSSNELGHEEIKTKPYKGRIAQLHAQK